MKYQTTPAFDRDIKRLKKEHRRIFIKYVTAKFIPAVEKHAGGKPDWPKGLRVKAIQGAKGIFEMTWSKKNPDGRATFEWVAIDGEPGILWRRVGDHSVFGSP